MSHTKLRPFIVKVSVLGYFPKIILEYRICNDGHRSFFMDRDRDRRSYPFQIH